MKEFYWNQGKTMLICEDIKTGDVVKFIDLPRGLLIQADHRIKELYPETHRLLCDWCGTGPGHEYARFYQFCACNFSSKDGRPDIDEDFNFIPEKVSCPIRHTCKRGICNPQLTTDISSREMDVIRLFSSYTEDEIAERLFISSATVHNHITHIYSKLGFTGKAAPKMLVEYGVRNNIIAATPL